MERIDTVADRYNKITNKTLASRGMRAKKMAKLYNNVWVHEEMRMKDVKVILNKYWELLPTGKIMLISFDFAVYQSTQLELDQILKLAA